MNKHPRENKNILLIGTALSPNQGTGAQCLSAYQSLKKLIPDSNFILLSHYPSSDSKRVAKYGIKLVSRGSRFLLPNMSSLLLEYKKADLVVSLHGDAYSDNFTAFAIPGLFVASLAPWVDMFLGILFKKPLVIFPQSIGPFKTRFNKFLARFTLSKAEMVMAREEITKKYLEEIGVDRSRTYLTADSAFLLKPSPPERVSELLLTQNINPNTRPIVGMSISQSIITYSEPRERKKRYDSYATLMAQAVDYLIDKLDATVVFVPHVTGPSVGLDDRIIGDKVFSQVRHKNKVVPIVSDQYTPEEIRGIIGHCDLFIGARMHANIAALSMDVPTVAIGFSHKTPGVMRMCGQERYACDIKSLTFKELASKLDDAWRNREKIKKELESKVEIMRETLLSTIGLIKQLLPD